MNGIQSLMQGAPTQPTQPTQPAPAMPAQNDPRMTAAMDVVDNDLDKLDLDPRTKALLKTQEAYDLLQSAERELAMSQPQPMPPTIEGQRKIQTMDGIAGMLQSLNAGMQQRGQQVQQAQARQMMGGLPTQPAPNMRFAASGGLIGYNEGGFLGKIKGMDTKLNAAADAAQNERMARGRRMSDYNVFSKPYDAAMNIMYDTGIAGALQKLTGYESQLNKPEEKDPMAEQLKRFMELQDLYETRKAAGAEEEELRRIEQELASYSNMVRNIEADAARARAGMARGGIVGYAGPTGSLVGGMSADEDFTNSNIYMPNELTGSEDEDIFRRARQQMNRDPEAEAIAAGERLRGLIGADELMAQRAEKQAALDARREARFSPEETRRRRISAGLAGLAERGLGGFGAGDTAERDKISAEQIASSEASVANMDKLIGELRELGMSQFEAERQAREMVQEATDKGANISQAIVDSRRRTRDAAAQDETTRRGQDIQAATSRAVANIQTSGSQFRESLRIRMEGLRSNNPDLSQTEIESRALNSLVDDEIRVGLARLNVSRDDQNRKEINDAIEAATKMLTANMLNNPMGTAELQTAIFELAREIQTEFYNTSAPSTAEFEEGATAVDAQGNRIVFRNGSWGPI